MIRAVITDILALLSILVIAGAVSIIGYGVTG